VTYDNRDRRALLENDRKDGSRLPNYKGSLNLVLAEPASTLNFNGTECWLNAWIKTSKDGVSLFYCFLQNL
jgi:hypothetical protein